MNYLVNMERLRALCAERGLSIAALERRADIGNGVIARWAENEPRVGNVQAAASVLGVTVDELLAHDKPTT